MLFSLVGSVVEEEVVKKLFISLFVVAIVGLCVVVLQDNVSILCLI